MLEDRSSEYMLKNRRRYVAEEILLRNAGELTNLQRGNYTGEMQQIYRREVY